MTGADALDVAKAATPAATKVDAGDPSGLKAGQTINITPDDTGKVPVTGVLVGLDAGPDFDSAQRPSRGRRGGPLPARRLYRAAL